VHGLADHVPHAGVAFELIELGQDRVGDVDAVFFSVAQAGDAFGIFYENIGVEDEVLRGHRLPVQCVGVLMPRRPANLQAVKERAWSSPPPARPKQSRSGLNIL